MLAHPPGGRLKRRAFLSLTGRGLAGAMLAGGIPGRPHPRSEERLVERWSWAMGQPVHLLVFAADEAAGLEACAAAMTELRRVEARLSLFDDASDLCELNRRAGWRALLVGEDLRATLAAAMGFRSITAGAFDAAVEPLMRVWGFHRPRRVAPGPAELAEARGAVQAADVRLDGARARLVGAQTQLDFGGIGVGYGLDRAATVLRRHGIGRAFLDVSGDCVAIGAPPGETGWVVDIADPRRPGEVAATTRLCDRALATSSNAVSVIRYGAALRGHVMNPATGWPAHAVRQVSVVARTAVAADALSTAMLVSGHRYSGALEVHRI